LEKILFLDSKTKSKVMEQMVKTIDELPTEDRQKVLAKMLENTDDLNPVIRTKLMDEMIKNIDQMPSEEREKFLAGLYLFN
jgi:Mg/Co/Ni transporter MgtE